MRHFNINAIALGMSRREVEKVLGKDLEGKRKVMLPYANTKTGERLSADVAARNIQFSTDGSVTLVSGPSLWDGAKEIVSQGSTAGGVRSLLGEPEKITEGHVVFTIGGFFWHYTVGSTHLVFSFTDDNFSQGDRAPLYQVVLLTQGPSK